MRPSAIIAIADGKAAQILNTIPGLSYIPEGHPHGPPRLRYERAGKQIEVMLMQAEGWNNVTLPWTSAGTSGKWDIYLLVAEPGSIGRPAVDDDAGYLWLTRAFRKLEALAAANPTYLRGPWSLAKLIEAYPAKAQELLQEPVLDAEGEPTGQFVWRFPTLAGDTFEGFLAVDYRPSQADIDGDVDPDPATLFGGEP